MCQIDLSDKVTQQQLENVGWEFFKVNERGTLQGIYSSLTSSISVTGEYSEEHKTYVWRGTINFGSIVWANLTGYAEIINNNSLLGLAKAFSAAQTQGT